MGANYTNAVTAVLKEDYGKVLEQLNDEVFVLAQIEKNKDRAQGKRAFHSLHVSRNSGLGARATGSVLPTAGNQGHEDAVIPLRKLYGAIKIERQLLKLTATNLGAFVNKMDDEMEGIKSDVRVDVGRQAWGTSDGVVAVTGVTGASTTVVLASTTTETQLRYLNDALASGRTIDIGTVAAPTGAASARTITAVNETAKTIVISGAAVTTAVTDRIFFNGNGGATSGSGLQNDGQVELTGLQSIISDTGSLHTVSPTSFPVWKSYVDGNSGTNRVITETMVTKAIQAAQSRSSSESIDLLACNFGVGNALAADMRAMRRNVDNVELKGGWAGIAFAAAGQGRRGSTTRAIFLDKDCPNNKLFGITSKDLVNYEADGWNWIDEDGSILNRTITSSGRTDDFEAELATYTEIAAYRRNSHFRIDDLSEV